MQGWSQTVALLTLLLRALQAGAPLEVRGKATHRAETKMGVISLHLCHLNSVAVGLFKAWSSFLWSFCSSLVSGDLDTHISNVGSEPKKQLNLGCSWHSKHTYLICFLLSGQSAAECSKPEASSPTPLEAAQLVSYWAWNKVLLLLQQAAAELHLLQ